MSTMEAFQKVKYDIVIKGGDVIDTKEKTRTIANVGIIKDKVSIITRAEIEGKKTIDATGKFVCPGFIDIHSHLDIDTSDYTAGLALGQGITTALTGNCGLSEFPIETFLKQTEERGYALNIATLVGHSFELRKLAGMEDAHAIASKDQIALMVELAEQALDEGAFGISMGLEYIPDVQKDEIYALASVAAKYDKLVPIHTRLDAYRSAEGLKEVFDIAQITGARVHISHLGYQCGYGQIEQAIQMLEEMREQGYKITCDSGAYEATGNYIGSQIFAPGWTERYGVNIDSLMVSSGPYIGQRCTTELWEELRKTAPQTLVTAFIGKYHEFIRALQLPYVCVSTDGGLGATPGEGHPQDTGTFPRVIGRFARELNAFSMIDAICKSTILPAQIIGLENKGWIGSGSDADIVIFDPNRIIDHAEYAGIGKPDAACEGMEYVIINGVPVMEAGQINKDVKPGKTIKQRNKIWSR